MTTSIIPLLSTAAQKFDVQIGSQQCTLRIREKVVGLLVDLWMDDTPIITGALARNLVYLVRGAYTGFTGDLYFLDTRGTSDPEYSGLGDRYVLVYDDAA